MDYGMEIINKETNQRCDYVSLDNILDTNLLESSYDEINNFILDKLSTTEDWQKYLGSREFPDNQKFSELHDQRFIIFLTPDNYDEFYPIKKIVTELLGSLSGIKEVQVFFDGDEISNEKPIASADCHVDNDNFIWVKLNTDRTLTVLERDESMSFDYRLVVGDKFSYFSPVGYFHAPPEGGKGIAMRISLGRKWFTSNNKSKICNDVVKYIKEFSYKVKITTGGRKDERLSFIDYSECEGHDKSQARFDENRGFMFDFNEEGRKLYLKDNTEEFYT